MGFLMRFAKLPGKWAIIIFLPLVGVAIWIGRYIPVNLPAFMPPPDVATAQKVWSVLTLIYCLIASVVPVLALLSGARSSRRVLPLRLALIGVTVVAVQQFKDQEDMARLVYSGCIHVFHVELVADRLDH